MLPRIHHQILPHASSSHTQLNPIFPRSSFFASPIASRPPLDIAFKPAFHLFTTGA